MEKFENNYVLHLGPKGQGGVNAVIEAIMNSKLGEKYNLLYIETIHYRKKFIPYITCLIQCKKKASKIELAHIHMASRGSYMRKSVLVNFFNKKSIPVVIHLHGAKFKEFYLSSSKKKQNRINKTFQKASQLIVLTSDWNSFAEKIGMSNKTKVIPNFTMIPVIEKKQLGKNGIWTFLFLGRLGKRKGSYDLIKAIAILIYEYKIENIKCIMAGDGEIRNSKKLIKETGLENYIELLGWVDSAMKNDLLSKADTLVLPSYYESFGLSLIEGMSYGLPVIGTTAGSMPQVIKNGKDGFLVTAGDINELAERMAWLVKNPIDAEKIGKAGREHAVAEYSEETFLKKIDMLYSKMLSS